MCNALCRDGQAGRFFPQDGVGVAVAKRTCMKCAVRTDCLEYALVNRIAHGLWGGCSERERRRILHQQPTAPVPGARSNGNGLDIPRL